MGIPCQAAASEMAQWLGGQLHGEDQQITALVPLNQNLVGTLSLQRICLQS